MSRIRAGEFRSDYDIAVIGGGIYGAALAWEARHRGARTLLIEQGDFASSVSANSMKTIHSGVGSLQSLDFTGMYASARERKILMRIAPHLVRPLGCMLPTMRNLVRNRFSMGAGMLLYNLMTLGRNRHMPEEQRLPNARVVSRQQFLDALENGQLNRDTLSRVTGSAVWHDAQAWDTERLVLAFVMAADEAGADVANYTRLRFHRRDQAGGYLLNLEDQLTGEPFSSRARVVLDARGYWKFLGGQGNGRQYLKAVNLVLDQRFSGKALGLTVPGGQSGRLLFLTPWGDQTIAGTWYFDHVLGNKSLALEPAELDICLQQLNALFENACFSAEDIRNVHVGLLPGEHGRQDPASGLRNLPAISEDQGFYTIQGVRYTTARGVAEQVLDQVRKQQGLDLRRSESKHRSLPGGGGDLNVLRSGLQQNYGFDSVLAAELVGRYGNRASRVAEMIRDDHYQLIPGMPGCFAAEIAHAVSEEFAETLADVLIRRLGGGGRRVLGRQTVHFCAEKMAILCDWSDQVFFEQIKRYYSHYPAWIKEASDVA